MSSLHELARRVLSVERPRPASGVIAAALGVAAATGLVYALKPLAPVDSLGVVYLPVVVLVAASWGPLAGVLTALLGATAFDYFHLPPVGHLSLSDSSNWVALAALVVAATATGTIAAAARRRAAEAERRRLEADLAAELSRVLLGTAELAESLPPAGHRLSRGLGLSSAAIVPADVAPGRRELAIPLVAGEVRVGTMLLPSDVDPRRLQVAEGVAPALGSILAAAQRRAALEAEVVETAALRRSDEMKTALLRSVSHDLRTPITAVLTAAGALDPGRADSVEEARAVVLEAGTRLWVLIDKLLDLSLLQSGRMEPSSSWYSVEELLDEAVAQVGGDSFRLSLQADLPPLRGDQAQLERAMVNVLENSARYSGGKPVSIRARVSGSRVRMRIVDQGPGIPAPEQARIFLPFYRAPGSDRNHTGSGLGLAIARGFIEASGGTIDVESLPGQGTSFVIELPVPPEAQPPADAADAPDAAGVAGP